MFKTALTHEANCLYVSEIVFKMTKTPDHEPHEMNNQKTRSKKLMKDWAYHSLW
jgi:hypothetical protein